MTRLLIAITATLIWAESTACDPKPFDPIDHGRDANLAVVGYVVGERFPAFEASVSGGENPPSPTVWGERLVRVAIVDTLKGNPGSIVEAPVACASPFPEMFERVVVVQGLDEYLRVFPADYAEADLRVSIAGAR